MMILVNKKLILGAIFFVSLIAISAVSASENITDDIPIGIDSSNDEILTVRDNGTFSDLQDKIDAAEEGSTVYLENNYINDGNFSSEGISITKAITVEGNGFTIDASKYSRIFNIDATKNVILNNIKFNAGNASDGGAIKFNNAISDCVISNCEFFINYASKDGGAIYFNDITNVNITDTQFRTNEAENNGGAIYVYGISDGNLFENVIFVLNRAAKWDGGAINFYQGASNTKFKNAYFAVNNAVSDNGGAINSDSTFINNTFQNSVFQSNLAANNGGAIYIYGNADENLFENVTFKSNSAVKWDGGAINFYHGASNNIFNNSRFELNKVGNDNGGAINSDFGDFVNNTFYNTEFIENEAKMNGGAIYILLDSDSNTFKNTSFINNTASVEDGGAINFHGDLSDTVFDDCIFEENYARNGGAINVDQKSNDNLFNNTRFIENIARLNGGAFYVLLDSVSDTFTKTLFVNNLAENEDGGAINYHRHLMRTYFDDVVFINNTGRNGGAVNVDRFSYHNSFNRVAFINNTARLNGGAFYVLQDTDSDTFTKTLFVNNLAENEDGGAINYHGVLFNTHFDAVAFINNTGHNGGAVNLDGYSDRDVFNNTAFINNTATGNGGALYVSHESFNDSYINTSFINNAAAGNGGAIIYGNSIMDVLFEEVAFINNSAENGGAIWFTGDGDVTNCNFTGNNATAGSAIYFYNTSATKTVSNSIFLNNRANADVNTPLQIENDGTNIKITFMGQDNLLNAIYSRNDAEVSFTNVTYWGANGITNTGEVTTKPSRSNKEAGQNITVTVVVNDILILNTTKVTDENGTIVLDIVAGNYTVTARHDTDSYYTQAEKNATFETEGTETSLTLTPSENIVNAAIAPEEATGNVTFIVKNESDIVRTVEKALNDDGIAELDLTGLTVGKYNVTATYGGNTNYYPSKSSIICEKVQLNSTIIIEVANITTDKAEIINITVNGAKDKNITVHVNEDEYTITDGTLTLTGLDEGSYNVTAFWKGDADYKEAANSTKFWTIENIEYYVNVTSLSTNNLTVNITAKSNIPNDIIQGKLLFTLAYGDGISANYNTDGTWWAVYTFGDYGDYNVGASYIGLDEVSITDGTISIRADVPINVSDMSINFGDEANVVVNVPEAIDGQNITIAVNTTSKNATVKNGKANAVFTDLPVGEYVITVDYLGDSRNSANSTTAELTVNKSDSTLTVDNVVLDYGETSNVTVATDGASGITAKINDSDAVVNDYTIVIPVLDAGNYTLTVTTIPDDNHNPVTETSNITVNKIGSKVNIKAVDNVTYGDAVSVKYSIENRTDNVTVIVKSIDGTQISDANIMVDVDVITVAALDAGSYTIIIINNEDKNTLGDESSRSFSVAKFSPSLSLKVSDISYGEVEVITVNCDVSGSVNLTVGNITETLELNGEEKEILLASLFDLLMLDDYRATLSLSNLDVGKYPVSAVFNGNENFESVSVSDEFEVNAVNPTMEVKAADISVGDVETVTVTLPDDAGGYVTVTVDGKTIKQPVDNGKAVFKLSDLKAGAYEVSVSYSGDEKYLPANGTAGFEVSKVKPDVAIEDTKVTDGKIVITLPDDATGSVTIEIDGKSYTAPVKDGKAVFDVPGLAAGKHDINVYYSGDDKYEAVQFNASITVEENSTDNHEKPTKSIEIAEADVAGSATGNPIFVLLMALLSIGCIAFKRFKS